jgi:hypothetical protein
MLRRPLAIAAFLFVFGSLAHAQQPASEDTAAGSMARAAPIMQALPNAEENSPRHVTEFSSGQLEGEFTAGNFIERTLYDMSGNAVGLIVDLGVDKNGSVSLVVVDVGNGGEDKRIAFAFDRLAYQQTDEDVRVVADVRPEDIDKAPAFTSLADAAALHDMQSGMVEEPTQSPAPTR